MTSRSEVRLPFFLRDECGGVTVESVLWVPIYALIFSFIADVAMIFHGQAKATRMAYDVNRQASIGVYANEGEVEAEILARLNVFSPTATADSVFSTEAVATTITMPASDLVAFGAFTSIVDVDVTFSSVHMLGV